MKNIVVRSFFGALAASVLMTGNVQAQELPPLPHLAQARLDVPVQSPGIPYYARLSRSGDGWVIPRNDDLSAVMFYRDPDCIPIDFDLGFGIDPPGPHGLGAFGCRPLFEGFDLRFSTLDPTLPPDYVFMRNSSPDFPIWFVATEELNELLDRGFVYIDEIEALPSRVSGHAWQFEEQLNPFGFNPEASIRATASGRLDDGGLFSFFWFYRSDVPDPFDLSTATELENLFIMYSDLPAQSAAPIDCPPGKLFAMPPYFFGCLP